MNYSYLYDYGKEDAIRFWSFTTTTLPHKLCIRLVSALPNEAHWILATLPGFSSYLLTVPVELPLSLPQFVCFTGSKY